MSVGRLYQFGPFRLDGGARLLLREGQRPALSPKAVELLIVLSSGIGKSFENNLHGALHGEQISVWLFVGQA